MKYRYKHLVNFLGNCHQRIQAVSLPWYKYYTELVVSILNYSRQYGVPVHEIFKSIRNLLIKDFQFERKFKRELSGAFVQFIMTAFITWFFILSSIYIVKLEVEIFVVTVILMLQISGIIIFIICYRLSKLHTFKWYDSYFKALLVLKSLVKIGLPIQKCIKQSEISQVLNGPLDSINSRLEISLEQWQKRGDPISAVIDDCLDELVFQFGEVFSKFIQKTVMYKFIVLSIFFLPCYLFYLFWIFQSFFEG